MIILIAKALSSSYFAVKRIEVRGNKKITKEQVADKLKPFVGRNLFRISSKNVSDLLSEFSWVEKATVKKALPDELIIDIQEEKPSYILNASNKLWLLSVSNKVIASVAASVDAVPIVSNIQNNEIKIGRKVKDLEVINAFKVLNKLDVSIAKRISKIDANSVDEFHFYLDKNKIQVFYGKAIEISKKNNTLKSILNDVSKKKINIYYIDLRVTSNPVIKKIPTVTDIQRSY